ncbi:MAG: competence/damage-inducible protein A [Clostridia bacterium]|nr:competence/damage-inducible protein A [Clostridia bacterium]
MIAEILCVGTELLMGQVLNTNAQFLARRLSGLGITLQHQSVVGDNEQRLRDAYKLALSRADVVITSGGLGPTVDDITKRVAAQLAGKELVLNPEAEAALRERFAAFHRDMPLNNLSQAMFTEDSILLPNPNGTAPGAIVPMGEGKVVIHLPGPPFELQPMFINHAEPWLQARSGKVLVSRYIRIFGMGESTVDELLQDLEQQSNPSLSPYCSIGEVQLRATACADTEQEAAAMLEPLIAEIRRRLGDVIYAVNDTDTGSLAQTTVELLKKHHLTVATAESLTGGMIAAAMVEVPGASEVVKGGFVTYQSVAKTMLLDVPAEMIDEYDVVSSQVAIAMAKGAREKLGVDIAVSATGLAGPGGGTEERPVGTVFLGLSDKNGTRAIPLHLTGNRERIRTLSMKNALNEVRKALLELEK